MGNPMKNRTVATTTLASQSVCLLLAASLCLPVTRSAQAGTDPLDSPNINTGDTAPALPQIGRICEVLRNAKSGNFIGKDKNPITFTNPACAAKSRRERNALGAMGADQRACQLPVNELTKGMSEEKRAVEIDNLCKNGSGTLNQEAAAYCTLRTVSQTGQATEYCEAYENAEKAQKGTTVTLALDTAAAGICWAEYLSMQALIAEINAAKAAGRPPNLTGKMGAGSILNSGACGGAAMAASLGEFVHTASIVIGGKKSGGEFKIDSDGNVKDKKSLGKVLEVFLSSGLSMKGLQLGICYYGAAKFPKICQGMNNYAQLAGGSTKAKDVAKQRTATANARKNFDAAYQGELDAEGRVTEAKGRYDHAAANLKGTDDTSYIQERNLELKGAQAAARASEEKLAEAYSAKMDAEAKLQTHYEAIKARANLAKQAAMIFTGLAAMRGAALTSAATTMKKSKEILQSMFTPNGEGAPLGMSGLGNVQQNIYAATGGGTYVPPGAMPVRAGAVSSGSPEAFMLPNGSAIASQAERLGAQIPRTKLEEAAAGGASGIGGMIASAATAAGAKGNLSEIRSVTSTMFANLPQDTGGGYAGGGARSVASTGGKEGGDLNLKSLFGGEGGGEGEAQAAPELAYREPANEDIWHSQNPKGHNLFQIVSDKYDSVQRKSAVGPEL